MKKNIMFLFLIFSLLVITIKNNVAYAVPAQGNIILDGKILQTSAPIQNINNRFLVPFREIGTAMGASINWDGSNQKISIYKGNRYSIMHIGQTIVQHGIYTSSSLGEITYTSQNFTQLDVAPIIIDNLTYIPVRGISETLGGTVVWNSSTSTAIITSGTNAPDNQSSLLPTKSPSPSPSKAPNYGDFSNTRYFKIISSKQAKSRYYDSNKDPFILVLYDSEKENSKNIVPNIQDIAQDLSYRIYGLDFRSSENNNYDNKWIWSFIRENNFEEPTILYVYSKNRVVTDVKPKDMNILEDNFKKFRTLADTDVDYGDFSSTTYFKNVTARTIDEFYRNKDNFMFVIYDSTDEDSKLYIPVIKSAAKDREKTIYAIDIDTNPNFYRQLDWLNSKDYDYDYKLPVLNLVYQNRLSFNKPKIESYVQPKSTSEVKSYIEGFLSSNNNNDNNNGYQDLESSKYFRNISPHESANKFANSNRSSYIIFVYNSSDYKYKEIADDVLKAAYIKMYEIYGVNTYNPKDKSDLYWFTCSNCNKKEPVIISIIDGSIYDYYEIKNMRNIVSESSDFISRHMNIASLYN